MNYKQFKNLFLIISFLVLTIFPLKFSYSNEKIKIAYFKLEPHLIKQDNKNSGALIDLWEKYIAPEMKVDIEWQGPLPPVRLFDMLKNGEINVVALLAKTEERLKLYDFPDESFFIGEAGVALLKENKLNTITSSDNFIGLKIGFFKDGKIAPIMSDKRLQWDYTTSTDWQNMNLNKLLGKRIDAAYDADSFSLLYLSKKMGINDKIKILTIPNTKNEMYSTFSKKDNGYFLKKYNTAVKKIQLKAKYKELLNKYI